MWHVSGYIPMHCKSRQEAGNIMMVPVISVASRQFKMKNTLFSCAVACKCVRRGFNLQTCFTIYLWLTNLLSIRLELFISPKCSMSSSIFFQKQTNSSYRFISEFTFFIDEQPDQSYYLAEDQTKTFKLVIWTLGSCPRAGGFSPSYYSALL